MCSFELKLQFILGGFYATQRIQMSFQVKASLFILKQFTSVIHIIIENKISVKKICTKFHEGTKHEAIIYQKMRHLTMESLIDFNKEKNMLFYTFKNYETI